MDKSVIIGIAGGSASGKTTVAQRLKKKFEETNSVVIIRQDDYYKDQSHMTMEERIKTNYDHPLAFDNELLVKQLDQLAKGLPVEKPIYDFVNHTRSLKTEIIEPADVIVLEGLFVLESEFIRNRLDIKLFVDTEADIRFIRRLMRDVKDRGRTLEHVVEQYTTTVKIMHSLFIEPSKRYADLIIPEGGKNEVAIDLLTTKISSIIRHNMI
ncbi:MAG: uridine kinase [Erysipelotrichaceae bacterium]|nr:uridine kinase [Erysipelotrichaceae bacterium]MDD3923751.1 uridine kinase [Erysipelotrichaceae bacterium]MDD4642327.1 uridine kinase [Erysipelotrichaceae bacterium]